MTVKLPDIALSRSGTDIIVTLRNFEDGDTWNLYKADNYLAPLYRVVSDHTLDSYTVADTDPDKNYVFRVSLNNAPISVSVTFAEDHTDEDPPYYVVEEKANYPITPNLVTIPVSWGPDLVDLQFYQVENAVSEWFLTPPQTTISKNKTL